MDVRLPFSLARSLRLFSSVRSVDRWTVEKKISSTADSPMYVGKEEFTPVVSMIKFDIIATSAHYAAKVTTDCWSGKLFYHLATPCSEPVTIEPELEEERGKEGRSEREQSGEPLR